MTNQNAKMLRSSSTRSPLSEFRFACPICNRILGVGDPCQCPACGTRLEITLQGTRAVQPAVFALLVVGVSSFVVAAGWSLVLSPRRGVIIVVWVFVLYALVSLRRVVVIARRTGRVPSHVLVRCGVPIMLAFVSSIFAVTMSGCPG